MKRNQIIKDNCVKESKVIIKEYRKNCYPFYQTELFIQCNKGVKQKMTSSKKFHIAGNKLNDEAIICKIKISAVNNNIIIRYSIKYDLLMPLLLYMKLFVHENNINKLILEDLLQFDNKHREKTIYTNINTTKDVLFLYITLGNHGLISLENKLDKPIGIVDEGNTSYMDVIIQNLFWISYIRKYVYDLKPTKESFTYYLQELFYSLQNEKTPVRLNTILNCLAKKYEWNQPKDPIKELFAVIGNIDHHGLEDLFKINIKKPKSKTIYYWSIDVKDTINNSFLNFRQGNFDQSLIELPIILLIHIGRFTIKDKDKKDCSRFNYESIISITSNQTRYHLFSVIIHEGKSLSNGVFYSYMKLPELKDNWWKLKGSNIQIASNDEVFEQSYGGDDLSYCFPDSSDKSCKDTITSVLKENDKTAYILIYINESNIKEMLFSISNEAVRVY